MLKGACRRGPPPVACSFSERNTFSHGLGHVRKSRSGPLCQLSPAADMAAMRQCQCRYCCKSPFALAIKNFPGFRRDFRVKMRGTSSPGDKLADDLGNAIEGTRISGRRSDFFYSRKIGVGQFGTFATISARSGLMHRIKPSTTRSFAGA